MPLQFDKHEGVARKQRWRRGDLAAVNTRGEGQVLADEITRQVWLGGNDSSNAAEFRRTSVKQNH